MTKDYNKIQIPDSDEKPMEDWDVNERRAYIFNLFKEAGLFELISQVDQAEKFDVSRVMIHKDINRLKEYYSEMFDESEVAETINVHKKIRRNAIENNDMDLARKTNLELLEIFKESGVIEKVAEPVEVEKSGDVNINISSTSEIDDFDY